MITVLKGDKTYPGLTRLAYTDAHETAYMNPYGDFTSAPQKSYSGKFWIPDFLTNGRLTMFIAGVPGAGKSYLAKEMINTLPLDCQILLFTALTEEDGNFSDFGKRLFKVKMTEENLRSMTLDRIREAAKKKPILLLFDDVDKIRDKKVGEAMFALLNDALANGRGHKAHDGVGDIHVIATSHALNDYVKTKYSLENSDYVALFPGSTTFCQLKRMFDKLGLSKELCAQMADLGKRGEFRSMIVHKTAPMYIIFGDSIMLV